jgi:hypothetical protein
MKSFRLEMLRAARLGRNRLPDSAAELQQFLIGQRGVQAGCHGHGVVPWPCSPPVEQAGPFVNRDGRADLYYTAFGLMCWLALGNSADEPMREYLASIDPSRLDLVHLSCWARSWALVWPDVSGEKPQAGIDRLAELDVAGASPLFSPYDAFLAVGIQQDLASDSAPPSTPKQTTLGSGTQACGGSIVAARVLAAVDSCHCRGGGYGGKGLALPLVSLTSAAMVVQWALDQPCQPEDASWLLKQCRGGFASSPMAKGADLLSTAVALLALCCCEADLSGIVQDCRRYVLALYDGKSFHPTIDDPNTDCEYALYGLMALGICDGVD